VTTLVRRIATAAITALTLTTLTVPIAQAHPRPDRQAPVQVWVTTPDRAELLHRRDDVRFRSGASDLTTITVDPRRTYQTMDGFGASITDSSASLLAGMDQALRDATMRSLFDSRTGIGVSFLRQPIGSSDFTAAAEHYTFDDVPAGQTDFPLQHFSIAHDERQILPLLRQAKHLNPHLTIMATPWSPPGWMKTGDSLIGGRLIDDPRIYDAYARYLVAFVQAYRKAGVPVDLLSVQNEPQNRHPNAYPGTDMPVAQQIAVIERLGPLLKKAGLRTKILAYDHNWATHPDDIAGTPPGADPETNYPYQILDSPAARWVAGTAFHCYYGDPSAQTALHDAHPEKGIWFTECSGSHGQDDTPEQIFRGTLTWHARNITIGTTRNWAKSAVNWNIALDENGDPHNGGCDTCTGLVTVTADGSVRTDAEYYAIGHLSKFVQPGARRIASTSFGSTGWNGQLMDVAFRNPDGTTALVVHNENDAPRSFAVALGDQHFEYTLPGGALATFVWPRHGPAGRTPTALDLSQATASASVATADAALAIDDDASTRWTTGRAQQAGDQLTVDLGRPRLFSRVALDAGDNLGDQARGWRLEGSLDGRHWRTLGSGAGTAQLITVDTGWTVARQLRVSATRSADSWWSIADIRLYR
jgi:glucosylceramidase